MNEASRDRLAPALRRTWLFGAGADRVVHEAMAQSGADVLIQDLEDFTPPVRRHEARALAPALYQRWREAGALVCVRINPLEAEGNLDLQDVMPGRPDIVAYPKSATALHMRALDASLTTLERALGIPDGTTEILPVCETALGVVNLREIAGASPRIRCAPKTWPPTCALNAAAKPWSWITPAGASCWNAARPASSRWTRPIPSATWPAPCRRRAIHAAWATAPRAWCGPTMRCPCAMR